MLEILKWRPTEADIRCQLASAPKGIEDLMTEGLKAYGSIIESKDAEELNVILAWLSHADLPLTIAELDTVLQRLSPSGEKITSVKDLMKGDYASLIALTRDDGCDILFRTDYNDRWICARYSQRVL
jgi:hypothetical protein